jgi:protocatechuate 3,4-dioxygenase beta subunit
MAQPIGSAVLRVVAISRRFARMAVMLRVRAIDEAGAPVAGAIVRHGNDENVATTDADGIAMVPITPGWASVTITHEMPAEVRLGFMLGEGSSGVIERTVTLRRGAPLRGSVVTPDGMPLPGAQIVVWSANSHDYYLESDDAGNWVVPAMIAGDYEARAGARGHARGPAIRGTHDGKTEQEIVLRVAVGARLFGQVRDAVGAPIADVRVYTEMHPGDDRSATTGADGRFEIVGLAPGRHHVRVGAWTSTIEIGGDGEAYELADLPNQTPDSASASCGVLMPKPAEATATLLGRVVRDGAPVSRFAIVRRGRAEYDWITDPAMLESPDGRFALPGLRESSCTVHVLALGCTWTSTKTIELAPGTTVDLGDIVLQRGLRITGTVCNDAGDPIAGARVVIGHDSIRDDELHAAVEGTFETTADASGNFAFDGVHLDGTQHNIHVPVRIRASHPTHGASSGHVLSGTDETVRLVLLPTGAIDGVVDPHGSLHNGVTIRPRSGDDARSAKVRPSGAFVVENLLPGEYNLELVFPFRPHHKRREARVTIVAGKRVHVRL